MPMVRDPEETDARYLHDFGSFKAARVLEIGCGDGRLTWRYAAAARAVVAIDPDAKRVATAVQNRPASMRVIFLRGTAEALPAPAETFDAAILAWSL